MPLLADCRKIIIAAGLAISLAGCAPESQYLRQAFAHPGPANYQRAQAVQHDPYLLDDVGPEVVGARPRDYQIPINEVERARLAAQRPGVSIPPPQAAVIGPAPVAVTTYPGVPTPSYATAPGPIVTTPAPAAAPPFPTTTAPQSTPFQAQQRAPY